jgi:hypothetical protein
MKKLRQLDDNLWVVDAPVRLLGVELGGRMTVVRLADGGLWLHSPVRIGDELAAELGELGPVTDLVAPNRFHHLHLPRAQRLFPDARSHAAPGLTAKRPDIAFTAKLSQPAPESWRGSLESLVFDAAPAMGEVVFLHRPSRTLILCDLCFNEPAGGGFWGELVCRLNGARRGLAPTRTVRFVIKDRQRARALVDQILEWDFDRVTVTHGSVVETGGHAAFADAFRFLPAV